MEQVVGVPVALTRLSLVHLPTVTQQDRLHTQGSGDVPVPHPLVEDIREPRFTHQEAAACLEGLQEAVEDLEGLAYHRAHALGQGAYKRARRLEHEVSLAVTEGYRRFNLL